MEQLSIKEGEKLVIIGGGFAGLQLAKSLKNKAIKVILIDKINHHQFQPLLYQVASARLEPASISFPFRKIFQKYPNVDFQMTEVLSIYPEDNQLLTTYGKISYDHLVIASGCTTNFFGNVEMSKNALSMKTTLEAIKIRNRILLSFEKETFASDEEKEALNNIVIVGAGPTGVELSGAFAELKNNILPKDYPNIDFKNLKIILLEGSKSPLNNMSVEAKTAASRYLLELGVELRTEKFITSYDGSIATLNDGTTIPTKNLIWAAGVTGNIIQGIDNKCINRNRYIVDRYNRLRDFSNIYALGDIAYMETSLYPNGHPQVANVAINQAKNLGNNIIRSMNGKSIREYEYYDLGLMATIGKHKAVVDLPFVKFHGIVAWYVWMLLHLMLILSVRNKLIVFFNWAWSYITKDTSLRLILTSDKKKV
jgi:NADH dehydrogenase